MPNKFVQVLTFFGFVCGCPACFGQSMMSAAHGTLVIIVADKDRIVAGADSLTTGVTVDGTDTSCKLMPLSKEMFFAATNKTAVSHVDSGKRVFSMMLINSLKVVLNAFGVRRIPILG
ncbi:MAG: hypothetical protein DMG77_03255 [Acidobacteria bacterium]|nr:MAG: hypothetical protein DMG77_03255 [Acidobacteriota bacterium]